MAAFSNLMTSMTAAGDGSFSISIPDSWMQGRTTYGGLSAALCLESVYREFSDLPPLRSVQVSFIGPAGDSVTLRPRILRRGRSVCFVQVEMVGAKGLATQAVFCFGEGRDSKFDGRFIDFPEVPNAAASDTYLPDQGVPNFVQHYENRLARGARPMSASDQNDHYIWVRHRDQQANGIVALLALADMPPPAVLPMLATLPPVSSMSWMLNILTPVPQSPDDWWLVRTEAEHASDGYSSQNMMIWNSSGEAIVTARQSVAVFF